MKNIIIKCDRCGKMVNGIIDETNDYTFTGGYYNVTGNFWKQFARENEINVCDNCMQASSEYHRTYNIGNE